MPHVNYRRGETRRSVNREVRCSCWCCGNPRKWFEQLTVQERKALEAESFSRAELYDQACGPVAQSVRAPGS
jgi:hypothetical protein